MSVSGCRSLVPTSVSTPPVASSAPAHQGATCWVMANPALAWSVCPAMKVTHTATVHLSPLMTAAPTSSCTTTWRLRAITRTQPPRGGALGAVAAEMLAHIPHSRDLWPVRRVLSSRVAAV